MNKISKALLLLVVVLSVVLAFPANVSAAPNQDGRTILGENYTLESGRILNGDLAVIGGVVNIEEDAVVNGNVFILGGIFNLNGTIEGDLTAIGSAVTLKENSRIMGDLISPTSYIKRNPGAVVEGDQRESWMSSSDRPIFLRSGIFRTPRIRLLPFLNRIARFIGTTLVMMALGALLLLILPMSAKRMTHALAIKPWHTLGYGALTALVMFVGGIILTVTICLIPLAILVGLSVGLAILVGWLTLGYELGKQIAATIFKSTWHPVLTAAFGNLVLYLIAIGLNLLPCLGGFLVFIAMLFGLGMSVVTLFGTLPYPRQEEEADEEQIILFEKEKSDTLHLDDVISTTDDESLPNRPIDSLDLDTRIINLLKDADIHTVSELLDKFEEGEKYLLDINGFGSKSLVDVKIALRQMGYALPVNPE